MALKRAGGPSFRRFHSNVPEKGGCPAPLRSKGWASWSTDSHVWATRLVDVLLQCDGNRDDLTIGNKLLFHGFIAGHFYCYGPRSIALLQQDKHKGRDAPFVAVD